MNKYKEQKNMDIFIDLLPLIVGTSGIIICIIALLFMEEEQKTIS